VKSILDFLGPLDNETVLEGKIEADFGKEQPLRMRFELKGGIGVIYMIAPNTERVGDKGESRRGGEILWVDQVLLTNIHSAAMVRSCSCCHY
jgi:hypothetical protein